VEPYTIALAAHAGGHASGYKEDVMHVWDNPTNPDRRPPETPDEPDEGPPPEHDPEEQRAPGAEDDPDSGQQPPMQALGRH
jgi:hypothetical protein